MAGLLIATGVARKSALLILRLQSGSSWLDARVRPSVIGQVGQQLDGCRIVARILGSPMSKHVERVLDQVADVTVRLQALWESVVYPVPPPRLTGNPPDVPS